MNRMVSLTNLNQVLSPTIILLLLSPMVLVYYLLMISGVRILLLSALELPSKKQTKVSLISRDRMGSFGYLLRWLRIYDCGSRLHLRQLANSIVTTRLHQKTAFSLYLTEDDTSNVLFGGIDKAKYTGDLATIDVIKERTLYDFFNVRLDSVSVHINGQSNTSSPVQIPNGKNVLLDSGTPYFILPGETPDEIFRQINPKAAKYLYEVDCALNLSFKFKGSDILFSVPFTKFIEESENVCTYAIVSSGTEVGTLGAPFLGHTYTTFHLEDNTIFLTKVKYSGDSNIVPIK